MSDDENYRDLADRLLQMEVELERARELLRAGHQKNVAVAVDPAVIAHIIKRIARNEARMADHEWRQSLSVKFECVVLLLEAFAKILDMNYIAALYDIERDLHELLLGMAQAAKESKQ